MTNNYNQPQKPKTLQEQLAEHKKRDSGEPVLTPQQRTEDAKKLLEAIRLEQDIESVKLGYDDFKSRERTISEREQGVTTATVKIVADQKAVDDQRTNLLAQYETHKTEYTDLIQKIKTREEEAERIMSAAISKKAEADKIIESQSEQQKDQSAKQEAYTKYMSEVFQLLFDLVNMLRRSDEPQEIWLATELKRDLNLMGDLNERGVNLQTLADVIVVDCDKMLGVCQYLQDSKKDELVLKTLAESVLWIHGVLLIPWTPNDKEGTLN